MLTRAGWALVAVSMDLADMVPDVLRHRLVLSYEALAEDISADEIVRRVLKQVPMPDKPLAHPKDSEAGRG